jgi:hypothetical protein
MSTTQQEARETGTTFPTGIYKGRAFSLNLQTSGFLLLKELQQGWNKDTMAWRKITCCVGGTRDERGGQSLVNIAHVRHF